MAGKKKGKKRETFFRIVFANLLLLGDSSFNFINIIISCIAFKFYFIFVIPTFPNTEENPNSKSQKAIN